MDEIEQKIKGYILEECLPGEDPDELTPSTPLISGGILDSLSTLKLVAFLEEQFNIEVAAHEASVDHLDTIELISALVRGKQATQQQG
jgi:acyl carrier protein